MTAIAHLKIIHGQLAEAREYLLDIGGSAVMLAEEIAETMTWLDEHIAMLESRADGTA